MEADELAECSSLIKGINADAVIVQTQNSLVKVASLLNQGIYNQEAASASSRNFMQGLERPLKWDKAEQSAADGREVKDHNESLNHNGDALHSSSAAPRSAQHAHKLQQDSGEHSHSSRVSTMAIRPSGPVPLQRSVHTIQAR